MRFFIGLCKGPAKRQCEPKQFSNYQQTFQQHHLFSLQLK
ncbi:hypothetical protein DFP91_0771 [Pseudorhodoplanes sinuspersici]|nr:hypothetical protein DFP91_0771 [Pseudorhodoplanes sinuspersici]